MKKLVVLFLCFLSFDVVLGGKSVLAQATGSVGTGGNNTPQPTCPPAAVHPDKNVNVRGVGQTNTSGPLGLIDVTGPTDLLAPQLSTLMDFSADGPVVTNLYQVNDWNWATNTVGPPLSPDGVGNFGASMVGFGAAPGQGVYVPVSGYDIGGGYQAVVLYADLNNITLHYTPADSVAEGYSIQIQNINVDPGILSDYQRLDVPGRTQLVQLGAGSQVGTAIGGNTPGGEVRVAIRDKGSYMDPRSRKDWWTGAYRRPLNPLAKNQVTIDPKTCLFDFPGGGGSGGLSGGRAKQYSEEMEIGCFREFEGPTTSNTGGNPDYRRRDKLTQASLRGDVGLRFDQGVFGAYCGQTKSEPMTVEETSPFDLGLASYCKWQAPNDPPWWRGEITLNYDIPARNFRVPFSEQINRDWAGTLSNEYPTNPPLSTPVEHKLEDLIYASGFGKSAVDILAEAILLKRNPAGLTTAGARAEMFRRAGATRLLLPLAEQDKLKCEMATYVAAKAGKSMYSGFSVDGYPIASFALGSSPGCPPSVTAVKQGRKLTAGDLAQDSVWRSGEGGARGKAWSKVPLYPNEKSKETLKFEICGDREYPTDVNAPEVFRMGLAANSLFQTLTSKNLQDNFYNYTKRNGLKYILDPTKSPLFGYPEVAGGGSSGIGLDSGESDQIAEAEPAVSLALESPKTGMTTAAALREIYSAELVPSVALGLSAVGQWLARTSDMVAIRLIEIGKDPGGYFGSLTQAGTYVDLGQEIWKGIGERLSWLLPKEAWAAGGFCFNINANCASQAVNGDGSVDVKCTVVLKNGGVKRSGGGHIDWSVNGQSQGTANSGSYVWDIGAGGDKLIPDDGTPPIHIPAGACAGVSYAAKIDECTDSSGNPLGSNEMSKSCEICNRGGTVTTTCQDDVAFAPASGHECDISKQCCLTPTCTASCAICRRAQVGPSDTTAWDANYGATHQVVGYTWNGSSYPNDPNNAIRLIYNVPGWKPGEKLPAGCTIVRCQPDDFVCNASAYCDPFSGKCGQISCTYTHQRVIDVYNSVPFLASAWDQAAGVGTVLARTDASGNKIVIPGGFMNIFRSYSVKPGDGVATGFAGCSSKQQLILDPAGNYSPSPGATKVSFRVTPFARLPGPYTHEIDTVTQTSTTQPVNVTFFRMGGMCNANTWVQDCVLGPYSKKGNNCGRGGEEALGSYTAPPFPAIRKDLVKPNMCQWQTTVKTTKPDGTVGQGTNNGRCIHNIPTGYYTRDQMDNLMSRVKDLGMTSTVVLYADENMLRIAAESARAFGITPIFRKDARPYQSLASYPWDRDIGIAQSILGYPPLIQIYNEPMNEAEWNGQTPNPDQWLTNQVSNMARVYNAGGRPGIQVLSSQELQQVIDKTKQMYPDDWKILLEGSWIAAHSYAYNIPPGRTIINDEGDPVGITSFTMFDKVYQRNGLSSPYIVVTEGGWYFGDQTYTSPDPNEVWPRVDEKLLAQYYQELYSWYQTGSLGGVALPVPNNLGPFCAWLIESPDGMPMPQNIIDSFKGQSWFGNLNGRDLDVLIAMMKGMSQTFERTLVCNNSSSGAGGGPSQSGFGGVMNGLGSGDVSVGTGQ